MADCAEEPGLARDIFRGGTRGYSNSSDIPQSTTTIFVSNIFANYFSMIQPPLNNIEILDG